MNKGERCIKFIESLKHVKGQWAGSNLKLESWQKDYVKRLFGTVRADGLRQYRTSFVFVPRKNAKSTLAAAMALYCLLAEGEKGGEIYSAAADREQASLVFDIACGMIQQDAYLSNVCKVRKSQKRIIYPRTNSVYRAISADAHTKHGFNASVVIYDELHSAPNRDLWDVLATSQAARSQPLMLAITTAGVARDSICYELYDYALKVRDGIIVDSSFLPLIYEAPKGSDWRDPITWRAANPNYGVSVNDEYFRKEIDKAKDLPSYLNTFLRLHLNVWTDVAEAWIPQEKWAQCGEALPDLTGKECYAGVDLSSTTDVTAVVLAFPLEGERVALLPRFYVPLETAKFREKRDRVPYLTWIRQGFITGTSGEVVDYDYIRTDLKQLAQQYKIKSLAIDRWNAQQLATQLEGDGLSVVLYAQDFKALSGPSKEFEKLVISKKLLHGGNPVLRWMASNVVAEQDSNGNVKPNKRKSTERIDGISATLNALGVYLANRGDTSSVYEERGIRTL